MTISSAVLSQPIKSYQYWLKAFKAKWQSTRNDLNLNALEQDVTRRAGESLPDYILRYKMLYSSLSDFYNSRVVKKRRWDSKKAQRGIYKFAILTSCQASKAKRLQAYSKWLISALTKSVTRINQQQCWQLAMLISDLKGNTHHSCGDLLTRHAVMVYFAGQRMNMAPASNVPVANAKNLVRNFCNQQARSGIVLESNTVPDATCGSIGT